MDPGHLAPPLVPQVEVDSELVWMTATAKALAKIPVIVSEVFGLSIGGVPCENVSEQ